MKFACLIASAAAIRLNRMDSNSTYDLPTTLAQEIAYENYTASENYTMDSNATANATENYTAYENATANATELVFMENSTANATENYTMRF